MLEPLASKRAAYFDGRQGLAVVELMVALTLMSLAAVAAFQTIDFTEDLLTSERIQLQETQREEAVQSFVYEQFLDNELNYSSSTVLGDNLSLPSDLANSRVKLSPIIGNRSRYLDLSPRCVTVGSPDLTASTFRFRSDCDDNTSADTLSERINDAINDGASISLAIVGSGGLCNLDQLIQNVAPGDTSVGTVESSNCLQSADGTPVASGSEIIFPRYTTHSESRPERFFVSMIENVTSKTPGMTLTGPSTITNISGATSSITTLRLSSLTPNEMVQVELTSGLSMSLLRLPSTNGVTVTGNGTNTITLSGRMETIRTSLSDVEYTSPNGYFGTDEISVTAVAGTISRLHDINVSVSPNCGGSTDTTAVRLDIGNIDLSNDFNVAQYVTAISRTDNRPPAAYYGYCQNNTIVYDNANGMPTTSLGSCSNVSPAGTFHHLRGRLNFYENNALTTFLYEEDDRYDQDRFSMFFLFEGINPQSHCITTSTLSTEENRLADARANGHGMTHADGVYFGARQRTLGGNGYCHVTFTMNNVEDGRFMDNTSDPFTVVDDTFDHSEFVGDNGTPGEYKSYAVMRPTPDGAVVPLRLPADSTYSATNLPLLSDYAIDVDNDGNVNPTLALEHWDSLQNWRIWAVNSAQDNVTWRNVPTTVDNTTAIQLRVAEAQRCD